MEELGLVVSDKIFENCILETPFFTPWPTNVTDLNHLTILLEGHPTIKSFCLP